MPKSKRAKVVHLSKVEKKGKEHNEKMFNNIREAADSYQHIFVFDVENMRNTYLKDVREQLKDDSRLFFGKTKVMAKALGSSETDEHLPNLSALTKYLEGVVGLLFTNRTPEALIEFFENYEQIDFARSGTEASRTFIIPAGVVYSRGGEVPESDDVPVAHSLEVTLRKWGMPTRLDKGKVVLDVPYTVCTEGETLNSQQGALLKIFGVATADFRVQLKAYYSTATQEVKEVDAMED